MRFLLPLLLLALTAPVQANTEALESLAKQDSYDTLLDNLARLYAQEEAADANVRYQRSYSLQSLANRPTIGLRGSDSSDTVTLGGRSDELVTGAVLHLNYTFSPALIPLESHLKILVNDEVVAVLPVASNNLGRSLAQDVAIPARLFSSLTNLRFQFIGHYTHDCEDPFHSSLWMEIAGSSTVELTLQPLRLRNDLALLPEPFFIERDFNNTVRVPFLFPAAPDKPMLNAAGIISSWFGKLAAWRGARFSARLDELLPGHAVVFVTEDQRPSFLRNYPKITGPALEMMTNPVDRRSKLLLILGRNSEDLKTAAQALVLGNAGLSGSHADIRDFKLEQLRHAYDAPRWVSMERPMKFGELVNSAQDLQVAGYAPRAIRLPLRIPPDLFTWRSRGVPIDLKYRYTPPLTLSESRLRMSVNDELVKSFILQPNGEVTKDRIRLPLIDEMVFGEATEFLLPPFKLGTRNELQFQFTTAAQKEGLCRDFIYDNVRDMIDADSKIDFTGFPHYAEMPNLNHFATAGFPFTKYADLAQTVVVMPKQPAVQDIETLLTVMGRMSESTGYPATRFRLTDNTDSGPLQDADLLLIGNSLKDGLLAQWSAKLPIALEGGELRNSQPKRSSTFLFDWLNFDTRPDPAVRTQQEIQQNGAVAAILGFESPLSSSRSVVALVSSDTENLPLTLDALEKSGTNIQGSAAFILPNKVESFLVGDTYLIGELPFWTSIWYPFANHPVLLAVLATLAVLVFAFALWRTLRVLAARRVRPGDKH